MLHAPTGHTDSEVLGESAIELEGTGVCEADGQTRSEQDKDHYQRIIICICCHIDSARCCPGVTYAVVLPIRDIYSYSGSISGMGPTGTIRWPLIYSIVNTCCICILHSKTYHGMRPVIMGLDMVEVRGRLERIVVPVKVLHPFVDCRVPVSNVANVAFEVSHIHGVEADLASLVRTRFQDCINRRYLQW